MQAPDKTSRIRHSNGFGRFIVATMLALTIPASTLAPAWAQAVPSEPHLPDADASITAGQVNQTYNSLNAGNYYNTPGGTTTFQNSNVLHLQSGTIHGFEVNTAGAGYATTGNGGNIHIIAPIVRLDGNIDVSGFMKGGSFGNGGSVRIDAAYLYQNGNIFANGGNGGIVTGSVGAMVVNGDIQANAVNYGGRGGSISLNATKQAISAAQWAIKDANGNFIGTYDPALITINGPIVNLNGIKVASGVTISATGADGTTKANGKGSNGGDGGTIMLR
jgi:hypothetical protein